MPQKLGADGLTKAQRYRRRHPEKIAAYKKEYKEKYPERIIAYNQANKDKIMAARKRWAEANPEKVRLQRAKANAARPKGEAAKATIGRNYYERKYGITYDEVQAMREQQGNRCMICGNEFDVSNRHTTYSVDHCHTEGHVRGLLCGSCNKGLGQFKDDPQLLANAIKYLRGD